MLTLNLPTLFGGLVHLFGHEPTNDQKFGISDIYNAFNAYGDDDPRKFAYMLATAYHETATTMLPVIETRRANEKTNPTVEQAIARLESSWGKPRFRRMVSKPYWRKDAQGLSWLGRGYPQVTTKANYQKAEAWMKVPFTKNPDLMLEPQYAAPVMVRFMMVGGFTGRMLGEFLTAQETNWEEARRTVNGKESAAKIATYAKQILPAVTAAMISAPVTAVVSGDTALTQTPKALPAPTPEPVAVSIPPEAPAPSLSSSKIVQAAGGISVATTLEVAKNASDYINTTSQQVQSISQQVNGNIEQVQQTVTVIKTTAGTFTGFIHQFTSPPVMIIGGCIILALCVLIWFKRAELKEKFGV